MEQEQSAREELARLKSEVESLYAPMREAVDRAIELIDSGAVPGLVLTTITEVTPGFRKQGALPHMERAARETGTHILYEPVTLPEGEGCAVIVSRSPNLSREEITLVLLLWRKASQRQ